MPSINLGHVYPTEGVGYTCYLNYTVTRSGTTVTFTNVNVGMTADSSVYTVNRVAASAYIYDASHTVCSNATLRSSHSPWDQSTQPDPEPPYVPPGYSTYGWYTCGPSGGGATITLTGITGTSVYFYVGVAGTGYHDYWGDFSGTPLEYSGYITVPNPEFTVSYNANGGTGTVPSAHVNITYGSSITLKSGDSLTETTSTTYTATFNANSGSTTKSSDTATATSVATFDTWHLDSASGTAYSAGSTYTVYAAHTFYAGYGTPTTTYGTITFPTSSQCTKNGYILLGWSTSSSATSATYTPGQSVTLFSTTIFYAVWRPAVQGGHVLRTLSKTTTWANMVSTQTTPGSTLYDVGGEYGLWSIDEMGYVSFAENEIKLNNAVVRGTATPVFGATYEFFTD